MVLEVGATAAILVGAGLARYGVARAVRHHRWRDVDAGRRFIVVVRNLSLLIAIVGLLVVWSEQLRVVGVSLVAFALALVIAGQDLIRSALGALTRTTSSAFAVGDLIVVGGTRGYVIDSSVTSTTLLEIGTGHLRTGRTVTVPNSCFLTEPVINETGGHRFILHSFVVPVPIGQWRFANDVLLAAAERCTGELVQPAKEQMEARARRHSLPMPIVEPLVFGVPADTETVTLTVRVPVLAQDVWRVEQEICRAWLEASTADPSGIADLADLADLSGPAEERDPPPRRRRDDRPASRALP